jgi:type I restriction enzyme S subunit
MKFREVQVQDVLDVQWGDTKTTKSSYVKNGYLAYSATGPDGFLLKFDYDCDGIVLSAIGANCGSTFFATNRWSCIKNTIRILPRSTEIDLKFFYFMTKSPNFWPLRGSAQPFISQTDIREMTIAIPDLATQRTIGEIIYSLELAIEMNCRVMRTLEEIAQTIFKSWFIDFDPVKAKMAGEKPVGMDDATAALFPNSMEDSELGPIPKAWSISKIKSLTRTIVGGTPSRARDDFWNGHIPWFNSGKVNDFRITEASEYITELALQKSAVKLLPIGTTVLAITGATLGQYSRVEIEASGTQNVIGILESDAVSNEFIYSFIANGIARIVAAGTGGAQQHINKEIVDDFEFIYPGTELVDEFTQRVKPMFAQIASLAFKNKTLADLRDALLPRLISGELQIPEEMLGV